MKARKTIPLITLLCLITSACLGSPTDSALESSISEDIWIHLDGEWQYAPHDDANPAMDDYRSALATLIRFRSDHELSLIYCRVVAAAGTLAISNGDGQAIYVGSWSAEEKTIKMKFRLVYEMVQPAGGGVYPGPEESASAVLEGETLTFQGKAFVPAVSLSPEQFEEFIAPERGKLKSAKP